MQTQTAYPTPHDTVLGFVNLAHEIAHSPDAAEKIRKELKDGVGAACGGGERLA